MVVVANVVVVLLGQNLRCCCCCCRNRRRNRCLLRSRLQYHQQWMRCYSMTLAALALHVRQWMAASDN